MTQLPGIAGEIEELIGLDLTVRLLKARGGTQVKIPKKAKGTLLEELVGQSAAEQLIEHFGIGNIFLPLSHMRGRDADRMARKKRAFDMIKLGFSNREIALECDLHMVTVGRYRLEVRDGRDADGSLSKSHPKEQGELPL